MDLNETVRRLEAAKGNPSALALATLDIVLESFEPKLAAVLDAAAVPHWFDEPLLRALLQDTVSDVPGWFDQVTGLTVVERFQAHNGWNVHDVTRLALRQRLFSQWPERFRTLSQRAAAHLEPAGYLNNIERVYHLIGCSPDAAVVALRGLWRQWHRTGDLGSLQALGKALDELCATEMLTPRTRAHALVALGHIRQNRIDLGQWERMARQAVDLMISVDDAVGLVDAYMLLGKALGNQGRLSGAIDAYERARGQLERAGTYEWNDRNADEERAAVNECLGHTLMSRGQLHDALDQIEAGIRIRQRLRDLEPDDPLRRRELAIAQAAMGDALLRTPRAAESETYFFTALEVIQSSADSGYGTDANDYDVAQLEIRLGDVLWTRGAIDAALQQYQSAATIAERLVTRDPDQLGWKGLLAQAKIRVGNIHHHRGMLDTAEELYSASRELYRELADRDSVNPNWQKGLGEMATTFGLLRVSQDRHDDARNEYSEAERRLRGLSESDPNVEEWTTSYLFTRNAIGRLLQRIGEETNDSTEKVDLLFGALDQFIGVREAWIRLLERDQDHTVWQGNRALTEGLIADALEGLASFTEAGLQLPVDVSVAEVRERALEAYTTAGGILRRLAENEPLNTAYRNDYSRIARKTAGLFERVGRPDDALTAYRAALAASEELATLAGTNEKLAERTSAVKEEIARLESHSR